MGHLQIISHCDKKTDSALSLTAICPGDDWTICSALKCENLTSPQSFQVTHVEKVEQLG